MTDRPIPTGQVAEMFGVSPETVAKWADEGKVPSFRTPGGQRRFYLSDITALLPDAAERADKAEATS